VNAIFLNNFIAKRIKMQTPADKGAVTDALIQIAFLGFAKKGNQKFHGLGEYLY
jgi:hypothetical protein